MKLKRILCMMLAIVLTAFSGCSSASDSNNNSPTDTLPSTESVSPSDSSIQTEPILETESEKLDMNKQYSILFIGNSYTYYNDMPMVIFKKLAAEAGYDVKITSITKGAHTLAKMADPKDEYGASVEKVLKGNKKFDFVVLQEQSARPAIDTVDEFYTAVRNLSARIRESGAEPILYSTWGRKTGSSTLTKYSLTNESMTWKLAASYQAIGNELDIPVAHAGLAFFDIYTGDSNIEIYNEDKSHPSYEGSYLAAATLFAKIFNKDPSDVNYNGTLTEKTAKTLRQAAAKAVFQTPEIPVNYKTSSEGVGN